VLIEEEQVKKNGSYAGRKGSKTTTTKDSFSSFVVILLMDGTPSLLALQAQINIPSRVIRVGITRVGH
jgi:hypothetical protein